MAEDEKQDSVPKMIHASLNQQALNEHDKSHRRPSNFSNRSSDGPKVGHGYGGRRASLRFAAQPMISNRRMSRFQGSSEQTSAAIMPRIKLENTYRLLPETGQRFPVGDAKKIINEVLEENLKDMEYDPATAKDLIKDMAKELNSRIKQLHTPRYKTVCNVILGQCQDQGLEIASRALWYTHTDAWTHSEYRNNSVFALGVVHALYYE